jgi:hypothetical protein
MIDLNQPINFFKAQVIIVLISIAVSAVVLHYSSTISTEAPQVVYVPPKIEKKEIISEKFQYVPKPFTMKTIKTKGCVADGFLSGYGDNSDSMAALIDRSECLYLHRSLETWLAAPDFEKARGIMEKVKKNNIVYGMFIAEAISEKAKLRYEDEKRDFDFSKMCQPGSDNSWGEHTCKPDLSKKEYQRYVKYIIKQGIDLGIQSFLFGQVFLQDSASLEKSNMPEILSEVRQYAKEKGVQIIVGAQTNNIRDEGYLRQFDYIEGGVGINSSGDIEDGPCLSRKSSCWALLWNDEYARRANNVILHLDWSGLMFDDMSIFARMKKEKREETLDNLYDYFTSRDMGFMMPYLATINRQNGGCYGPKKRYYSPDNKYNCKDEDTIKKIMNKQN